MANEIFCAQIYLVKFNTIYYISHRFLHCLKDLCIIGAQESEEKKILSWLIAPGGLEMLFWNFLLLMTSFFLCLCLKRVDGWVDQIFCLIKMSWAYFGIFCFVVLGTVLQDLIQNSSKLRDFMSNLGLEVKWMISCI